MTFFGKIYKFSDFFIYIYAYPNMAFTKMRCMVVICNCFVTYFVS